MTKPQASLLRGGEDGSELGLAAVELLVLARKLRSRRLRGVRVRAGACQAMHIQK